MDKAEKRPVWDILHSALVLAVISGAITAALGVTNLLTRDTIQRLNDKQATEARQHVIEADRFEQKSISFEGKEAVYHEAYLGDKLVGYVFLFSTSGKSGGLVTMTGLDVSGTITGVTVTQDNETAGYVKKVEKAGLFQRLQGMDAEQELSLGTNIDGVSQATKTSKGVIEGVNKSILLYQEVHG